MARPNLGSGSTRLCDRSVREAVDTPYKATNDLCNLVGVTYFGCRKHARYGSATAGQKHTAARATLATCDGPPFALARMRC